MSSCSLASLLGLRGEATCCWRPIGSRVAGCKIEPTGRRYFTAVETDPNVVLRLVPTPFTTAIIATAMPDAMRPYSMAVAPDSSLRKAVNFRRITQALRCVECTAYRRWALKNHLNPGSK
jgi:hypothetical protein